MTTIADLSVRVGIDSGQLEKGAQQATKSVNRSFDSIDTGGLDRAGKSVDRLDDTMGSARGGRNLAGGLDRVGESADQLDTRAMGFRDTMTGVQDTMLGTSAIARGDLFEGFFMLGMGIGDLASGVANFGVQMAKTAGRFIAHHGRMLAVHMANAARMAAGWLIAMGPIGIVILAIGAIIGILAALGVDFDDVSEIAGKAWDFILGAAKAVWNWLKENWPLVLAILTGPIGVAVLLIVKHWDKIKAGFTAVKDWISDRIGDIVGFFKGLPGRLARAASGMWDFIKDTFKGAINAVIGWWNNLRIPGFSFSQKMPGPIPDINIDFKGIDLPDIPTLQQGGIVRATPGGVLALLGEGGRDEAVVPLPHGARALGGGPSGIVLRIDPSGADEEMARLLHKMMRTGQLEAAPG